MKNWYQVIDDVEAIVVVIAGVDASVLLLSHVIFQGRLVSEDFLTVQTLHTVKDKKMYLGPLYRVFSYWGK